ncbi:MAG: VacJ family lipoprotein [Rhodobiaceae bacterium]|nr:VacJ family lipoprotein [Rhodobiaceae bacterium]
MYIDHKFIFYIGNSMSAKNFHILAFIFLLTGCTSMSADKSDPFEVFNRSMFAVNQGLDKVVLKPTAQVYSVLPQPIKMGIGNVLSNLSLPVTFFNETMQGEVSSAGSTLLRLSINSTVGVAGIFDVATGLGIKHSKEDFGQTLGVYGFGSGPYIFLPILGPGNPRDLIGRAGDAVINPVYWAGSNDDEENIRLGVTLISGIHARENALDLLEELENTSVDYYASVRSLYIQNRESEIKNGTTDIDSLPEIVDLDDF